MIVKSLIIGGGEIGTSLKKVLDKRKNVNKAVVIDKKDKDYKIKIKDLKCSVMHVCIPYSASFGKIVFEYDQKFEPELIIIHSTVPVGMTSIIEKVVESYVVHSPVRGNHPDLEKSLLTFTKYIGTTDKLVYLRAKKELSNMKTVWFKKPEETELGKLLCTSYYGLCIAWHREMERYCKKYNADFNNVVTDFNNTYNTGYKKLRPNVLRPVLSSPGKKKIGGHCVIPNATILNNQLESPFLSLIK